MAKRPSQLVVDVANQQANVRVQRRRLQEAVSVVLRGEGIRSADVSVAVVDDPTIHRLNREYLRHDYPTDVLSFLLSSDDRGLEGEVVVSADTAQRVAYEFGWPVGSELALYLVHGTLHLTGYDDQSAADRAEMRARERRYLGELGITDIPARRIPASRRREKS